MNSDNTVSNPKNAVSVTDKTNYKTTIIIDKQRSFLQRLFPTNLHRMLNKSDLKQAGTELEFREKAFKMAKESQLQSIKEIYNDFLVRGKGDIRKERTVFFVQKLQELEMEIGKINDSFTVLIQEQQTKLDEINVPLLKQFAEKQIEKSMERFFDTVNKLMGDFQNILNEEIST